MNHIGQRQPAQETCPEFTIPRREIWMRYTLQIQIFSRSQKK